VKKSSSIAIICMSVFTAVLIVSVVSAYDSTYGFSLHSLGFNVYMNNNGMQVNATVGADNLGITSVTMYADNGSYNVQSGYSVLNIPLLPLSSLIINSSGFPLKNMTVMLSMFSDLVALFFNLSKTFILGNISIGAPFEGFLINGITKESNATGLLQVSFNSFFPFIISITKIVVSIGSQILGNISLSNMSEGFHSLSSYIKLPASQGSYDLTFRAGSFSWNEDNVEI